MANTLKLNRYFKKWGYTTSILDILELFGNTLETLKEYYFPLGNTNFELAKAHFSIVEQTGFKDVAQKMLKKIEGYCPEVLFLLSWEHSIGALFSTGLQVYWPTVSKLYVHTKEEIVPEKLFEPASLLITESLHGSERALASGIPPWKIVYFPHPIVPFKQRMRPRIKREKIVIGAVTRLVYGKNCEFALEAIKRLAAEGFPVLFCLKGDFDPLNQNHIYNEWLKNLIHAQMQEPWFKWDQQYTPPTRMGDFYASIDIFLYLSGFESGSNVIVEAIGNKKPALILDIPTNQSLFKNGALFVNAAKEILPQSFFALPDKEDLYQKLKMLVSDNKLCQAVAEQGYMHARKHFAPSILQNRLPLILEAAKSYFQRKESLKIKKNIEALYQKDVNSFLL